MTGPSADFAFASLSLVDRPELFAQILEFGQTPCAPLTRGTYGGKSGWLVADGAIGAAFLASAAGVKSRPVAGQRYLGGVGALRGDAVERAKRLLVSALAAAARDHHGLRVHLVAALPNRITHDFGPLTEAFSSAMLTQLTGQNPASIAGGRLRDLVFATWDQLEAVTRDGDPERPDEFEEFLASLVYGSDSAFLATLRSAAVGDRAIVRELRAMVLSGWGSTTAATLSAIAHRGNSHARSRYFLNEVMRLYPPGFMVGRRIVASDERFPFAVGDTVLVSPWLIHRNSDHWARAAQFDVTRWGVDAPGGWFIPFGVGPRRCPASAFATAQIGVALEVLSLASAADEVPPQLTMVEQRSPALVGSATSGCPIPH